MMTPSPEQRLLAHGLRLLPTEAEAMAVILATLDAAAEFVRAPLPVSAEPAAVLVLKGPGPSRLDVLGLGRFPESDHEGLQRLAEATEAAAARSRGLYSTEEKPLPPVAGQQHRAYPGSGNSPL